MALLKIITGLAGVVNVIVGDEILQHGFEHSSFLFLLGSLFPYYAAFLCFDYAVSPVIYDSFTPLRNRRRNSQFRQRHPHGLPVLPVNAQVIQRPPQSRIIQRPRYLRLDGHPQRIRHILALGEHLQPSVNGHVSDFPTNGHSPYLRELPELPAGLEIPVAPDEQLQDLQNEAEPIFPPDEIADLAPALEHPQLPPQGQPPQLHFPPEGQPPQLHFPPEGQPPQLHFPPEGQPPQLHFPPQGQPPHLQQLPPNEQPPHLQQLPPNEQPPHQQQLPPNEQPPQQLPPNEQPPQQQQLPPNVQPPQQQQLPPNGQPPRLRQ